MSTERRLSGVPSSVYHRLSLPDIVEEYLLTLKLDNKANTTQDSYQRKLKVLCLYMVNHTLNIEEITNRHIRFFLASLQDRKNHKQNPISFVTISAYYRCLRTFFGWCINEGYIQNTPMHNIKAPKTTHTVIQSFSEKDIENILLCCDGNFHHWADIRNKALVLVALDTGMRLEELSKMLVDDVNMDTGIVKLLGKGNKERFVRVGINTRKALLRYMRIRNNKYPALWQSEELKPITRAGLGQVFGTICKRARISDARGSAHTFRHTCAMMILRNGGTINDIKELFGHSKISTTQIYLDSYTAELAIEKHVNFSPVDNLK